MKYQGKITDPKDLVTKEYVDTGLSGKQNTLTFDTTPTAGSSNPVTSDGIKSALDTFVRPNLIDNAYFVGGGSQQGNGAFPINQRGQTIYQSNEYTIDRWIDNWAQVEVLASAVRITTTSAYQGFIQRISKSTLIVGEKYTFSILSYDGTLWSWTFTVNTDNAQWLGLLGNGMYAEIQHYQTYNYWSVNIVQHPDVSSATMSIVAVKLELGPDQTLAHQENGQWVLNEIPNYEEQLIRCKSSTADSNDTYANGNVSFDVPNPNLIDNWYFVGGGSQQGSGTFPINQRGQTIYSGTEYCIDRWHAHSTPLTLESDGLAIGEIQTTWKLSQLISVGLMNNLKGKTITFSILFKENTSQINADIYTNEGNHLGVTKTEENGIAVCTYTVPNNITDLRFVIYATAQTAKIIAVKLELGSNQTLAHQENGTWVLNEIPNYQQELTKCQRYYYRIASKTATGIFNSGVVTETYSGNRAIFVFRHPVEMLRNPAISVSGSFGITNTSFGNATYTTAESYTDFAVLYFTCANTIANGSAVVLQDSGSNNAVLEFSAEL